MPSAEAIFPKLAPDARSLEICSFCCWVTLFLHSRRRIGCCLLAISEGEWGFEPPRCTKSTSFSDVDSDNTPYEKIGTEVRSIADEIPFDIPETWEWVRCSTLGEIVRGSGIKRTETVPWGILHASAVAVTKYLTMRQGKKPCYTVLLGAIIRLLTAYQQEASRLAA